MADPLNFRFMDARLKNGVYPFAFLFSPLPPLSISSFSTLSPCVLPLFSLLPFCISPFSEIPPSLAPLPPLRLNNYPPFDDFALLLSYHILHMQIFIDHKNSEIKRFHLFSSLVSPSLSLEREREIFFYINHQILYDLFLITTITGFVRC